MKNKAQRPEEIKIIAAVVCRHYCTISKRPIIEFLKQDRHASIMLHRHQLCYLLYSCGGLTMMSIGDHLRRDRTTIRNSIMRVKEKMKVDHQYNHHVFETFIIPIQQILTNVYPQELKVVVDWKTFNQRSHKCQL